MLSSPSSSTNKKGNCNGRQTQNGTSKMTPTWPLLQHTTDTTFYFLANNVNLCSVLSRYIASCFKGIIEKCTNLPESEEESNTEPSIMDEPTNSNTKKDNPNRRERSHSRNHRHHYRDRRPPNPDHPKSGMRDFTQQMESVSRKAQTILYASNQQPRGSRPGVRIQVTEAEDRPLELGLGLTTYQAGANRATVAGTIGAGSSNSGGGGGGGVQTRTGGQAGLTQVQGQGVPGAGTSGGGRAAQGQGGEASAGMGNQGIRQHVETSTKTGVFHLSKAKLHEFPPELAKIVNALRSIDLSENKITVIPQNISAFVNLKHLNLSFNQIDVIPDQIGQLAKLETLSLSNNRIKTVPSTVAHLQKLRDVNLSCNQLTVFPVVFSSLKYLTVLDLGRNRIPEVPDGVGGLQVVELILNQNQVRAVSKDLANCPNLKTLRLQENTLELAGLPKEILSESPVSLLSLEGNLFDVKQLQDVEGYDKYMERYTSTKKKLT